MHQLAADLTYHCAYRPVPLAVPPPVLDHAVGHAGHAVDHADHAVVHVDLASKSIGKKMFN